MQRRLSNDTASQNKDVFILLWFASSLSFDFAPMNFVDAQVCLVKLNALQHVAAAHLLSELVFKTGSTAMSKEISAIFCKTVYQNNRNNVIELKK